MKKLLVVHPILFSLFPVVFVYAQNQEQLSLSEAWVSVLILSGSTVVFWLLLSLILRSAVKAGVLVSLFLVLFFSYGHVRRMLPEGEAWHLILLIVMVAIFASGMALIPAIKRDLQNLTRILNVMALVLVAISLTDILAFELTTRTARPDDNTVERVQIEQVVSVTVDTLPNIYYLILDGYARADVLAEIYDYDNSGFLGFLNQKGFYVADCSHSNYAQTALSMASTLNLKYLDDLAARVGVETQDRQPLDEMIQNSTVSQFLRQQGYQIVAFPTSYPPTDLKNADIYLGSRRTLNELEIGLLVSVPISWLAVSYSDIDPNALVARGTRSLLDRLSNTTQLPAPHFVFAHIMGPHPPFVFDEHGNETDSWGGLNLDDGSHFFENGGTREQYVQGYTAKLTFINRSVKGIIENLISQSTRPAVIILQSDHGPGLLLDWDDPENSDFRERLSILNAYLLPGGSAGLYEGISPVNTFRLIFNRYLGTDLKLLDDASYFSTWDRPYEFIDATEYLQSIEDACPLD
jgi:hypothetical protein